MDVGGWWMAGSAGIKANSASNLVEVEVEASLATSWGLAVPSSELTALAIL